MLTRRVLNYEGENLCNAFDLNKKLLYFLINFDIMCIRYDYIVVIDQQNEKSKPCSDSMIYRVKSTFGHCLMRRRRVRMSRHNRGSVSELFPRGIIYSGTDCFVMFFTISGSDRRVIVVKNYTKCSKITVRLKAD